jgi:hypothetical protein
MGPREDIRELIQRMRSPVAVVMVEDLQEAQCDPRVRSFLDEADSYLDDLEEEDRDL